MFKLKLLLPALLALAAFPSVSNAQVSIPLCTTTYTVQVQYEHWTSGGRYWSTKFTTDDQQEAQLVYELFAAALEAGELGEILDVGFYYIIVDVRLVATTTCHYPTISRYQAYQLPKIYTVPLLQLNAK